MKKAAKTNTGLMIAAVAVVAVALLLSAKLMSTSTEPRTDAFKAQDLSAGLDPVSLDQDLNLLNNTVKDLETEDFAVTRMDE